MNDSKVQASKSEKLIRHIERVAVKAKNSKLSASKLNSIQYSLSQVAGFIACETNPALLFAAILTLSFKKDRVGINDLANFFGITPMKVANFFPDLEILEKKRLIRSDAGGRKKRSLLSDINYFITRNVLDAVFAGSRLALLNTGSLSIIDLLSEINEMVDDREENKLSYSELVEDTRILLENNNHLLFVKKVRELSLEDEDLILLMYVCHQTINISDEVDLRNALDKIFDDSNFAFSMRRSLVRGINPLIKSDLVHLQESFFRNDRDILLTDKGVDILFDKDAEVVLSKDANTRKLILPKSINRKKLFFNSGEDRQLDFLDDSLQEKNFQKLISRLKSRNMKAGFTILFHGSPGTGKTESVYQLARKSGRPVMKVEISETKSMWFGESEKQVKAIFENYRKVAKHNKLKPILLFNEADGVLGTRKKLGGSPVDQTENAIQNILLQELEDFEGILIATTNLTDNLDRAFERRFLYKILFQKPDSGTRFRIWKDKIPQLEMEYANILAGEFDFSGGQIENVARKFEMEQVLNATTPGLAELRKFCQSENFNETKTNHIGFK